MRQPGSIRFEVIEQRGLADPGLASHDEHLTLPRTPARNYRVEGHALTTPAEQHGLPIIRSVTHDASGETVGGRTTSRRAIESD
jgi:hypothetical protein